MSARPGRAGSSAFAALLFDLDGTLIETDDLHSQVFADIGRDHGVAIDRARYDAEIQGRHNAEIFADLFPGADAEAMSHAKEAEFRRRLAETGAERMPGLTDLLDWAARHALPTAVVTNAPRVNAEAMLAALGLGDRFDTMVIADECARGKPDPLPYLTAIERFGLRPADCLAFEDSRSGVAAASAAGARVLGIRSSLDDATLRAAGAHATIRDFTDPVLWDLIQAQGSQTA